jgi:hypothetical protein
MNESVSSHIFHLRRWNKVPMIAHYGKWSHTAN